MDEKSKSNFSFFSELINLQGEQGAKLFLKKYSQKITSVEFKDGLFDIDTPEDLCKLTSL